MTQPQATDLPFEKALVALERVVRDLEEGNLGLDEALAQYEQGVGLIKRCYGELRRGATHLANDRHRRKRTADVERIQTRSDGACQKRAGETHSSTGE